jgi:uncharacterized phage-associated protein
MATLQFDFDAIKLGQALAYLATGIHDLTKLKAAKLLYFADKRHLVTYGRPITGDRYYCLDHGPVPSASLNAINDLLNPVRIRLGGRTLEHAMSKLLAEYLHVEREGAHPRLTARVPPARLDALTATEREVLDWTAKTYGRWSAGKLIDETHRENPWLVANSDRPPGSSVEIPWESFLESAADDVLEHIQEHQESKAFFKALQKTAQR